MFAGLEKPTEILRAQNPGESTDVHVLSIGDQFWVPCGELATEGQVSQRESTGSRFLVGIVR